MIANDLPSCGMRIFQPAQPALGAVDFRPKPKPLQLRGSAASKLLFRLRAKKLSSLAARFLSYPSDCYVLLFRESSNQELS